LLVNAFEDFGATQADSELRTSDGEAVFEPTVGMATTAGAIRSIHVYITLILLQGLNIDDLSVNFLHLFIIKLQLKYSIKGMNE